MYAWGEDVTFFVQLPYALSMDRHYDLSYLNQVFHGNEVMIQEIVRLFLEQAPRYGMDMLSCVEESRWGDLHPIAHRMKSSVNMLGMQSLIPVVLAIEQKSKFNQDESSLPELVQSLNAELKIVCAALQTDWSEVKPSQSSSADDQRLRRA